MKSWGVNLPHDLVMKLGLKSGSIVSRHGGLMIFILPPGGGEYLIEQDAVESRMRRH